MQVPLLRLQCGVNSYAWGKKGHDSTAAKFAAATPAGDFSIQSDKPYSEVSKLPKKLRVDIWDVKLLIDSSVLAIAVRQGLS